MKPPTEKGADFRPAPEDTQLTVPACQSAPARSTQSCAQCLESFIGTEWEPHCPACRLKLGHIAKALCDPFDYALGLKNGAVLRFTGENARLLGDWLVIPKPDA